MDTPSRCIIDEPSPHPTSCGLWNGADIKLVRMRLLAGVDGARQLSHMYECSKGMRCIRFFGFEDRPDTHNMQAAVSGRYQADAWFGACLANDGNDMIVGVSRLSLSDRGGNCECAIHVCQPWQTSGLEALFLRHVSGIVAARGFRFLACDSADVVACQWGARFGFVSAADCDELIMVKDLGPTMDVFRDPATLRA